MTEFVNQQDFDFIFKSAPVGRFALALPKSVNLKYETKRTLQSI